jgi:hypothetical protein
MAAKASSARRDIHALPTWLNLDAYAIRTASAEPLRRVYSHFTSCPPRRQRIRA